MNQRIDIYTRELSRSFWELTYSFIQDCINGYEPDESYCISYMVEFQGQGIVSPDSKIFFRINYLKDSYKEDFPEMVPFFMITRGVQGHSVTLAIDLGEIPTNINSQQSYIFKCSEFFRFMDSRRETNRILFLNEKTIDEKTGKLRNFAKSGETSLRLKESDDPASRKYLPLIEVSGENFNTLFEQGTITESSVVEQYILDVINKISKEQSVLMKPSSLFEEWFIKSYYYYLEETYTYNEIDYSALEDVLHIYCSNIYELIQNIIYHTSDQCGLMYFVFSTLDDLSVFQRYTLGPSLYENVDSLRRFISIGIIDFNREGITESFKRKYNHDKELELIDFYSPKVLPTNDVTHLDFRRMAHIGLPVLMSTIRNYHGYFRVESNKGRRKQSLELKNGQLSVLPEKEYVDGTHYEIILPIVPSNEAKAPEWSLMQKSSIMNRLIELKKSGFSSIPLIKGLDEFFGKELAMTKDSQMKMIESAGQKIQEYSKSVREIAIDFDNCTVHPSVVVKLVSYLQNTTGVFHPVIILTSLSDDLMDTLCSIVKTMIVDSGIRPVWNPKAAVILISKKLRYQVITGNTPDDLYSINAAYQNYYYSRKNYFETDTSGLHLSEQEGFILPYEVLVGEKHTSFDCFVSYVHDLLKQPATAEKMGYCLNQYTYIGNKLIVRYFYEADSLFQNSFFTDRFAYIIAERIKLKVFGLSKLVIVGYKYYSEQLVKTVSRYLKETYDIESNVYIAEEDDNGQLYIRVTQQHMTSRVDNFVTIVPIGATLSTNDKVIAVIKQTFGESVSVVYNHCSIVVRDKEKNETPTDFERDQKWDSIDFKERIVHTRFENAKEIHYDILLGALKPEESNWLRRLNSSISFPDPFGDEEYVNHSENASINSQNLLGIPRINRSYLLESSYNHQDELKRLYEMKDYIYSGHIEYNGSHFRYYFDTEGYFHRGASGFCSWLDEISTSAIFEKSRLNILISPNARIESDLVNEVNERVFGGNALILFFDVNNWKNNIINKFSYLAELIEEKGDDVCFHYVDHSLFTASTYKRTKSYLNVLCPNVSFKSGIVVVNRLNNDLREEIYYDFGKHLFAYFNLFVPETGDLVNKCTQCELIEYYNRLLNNTSLSSCRDRIERNKNRIEKKELNDFKRNGDSVSDRRFLRLFFAHEIFYRVSLLGPDDSIEGTLEPLYKELFINDSHYNDEGLVLLNQWYNDKEVNYRYDKKISFLKALSSPPMSRYILLRKYAHKVLLITLTNCLNKEESEFTYNDFRLLKAVLKSLSFYKSNAVIRKEVILNTWKLQICTAGKIRDELDSLPQGSLYEELRQKLIAKETKLSHFGKDYQFFIKNATFEDGSKSSFLGELLRTGIERRDYPVRVSRTLYEDNNPLSNQFPGNKQYQSFLSDVFLDNTTITRRTLAHFEREIDRDIELKALFFEDIDNRTPHAFSTFEKNIPDIKELLTEKVHSGYYYSYFEPYLDNEDYINFVEKFAYLLFLRFKFAKAKLKYSIENEIEELLKGFSRVMDAQISAYAVGDEDGIYCIDTRSAKGERLPHDSYVNRMYRVLDSLPDIVLQPVFPLFDDDYESSKFGVQLATSYIVGKQKEIGKSQSLSFFFDGDTDEDYIKQFIIKIKESSRLLLLLREEMNDYFINFLLKERVVDLWIEKNDSHHKFEKIYQSSSHVFNLVFEEMVQFESMEIDTQRSLHRIWFWLTNEIISYLYSNIEKHTDSKNRHYLQLDSIGGILDEKATIGSVFDTKFQAMLQTLLSKRWDENSGNRILINGHDIRDGGWSFHNPNAPIHCRKELMRTFIVQCLNNSLARKTKDSSHGHRGDSEIKTVEITVTDNTIRSEDCVTREYYIESDKRDRAKRFDYCAKNIRELTCKRYSSTTLTTIQGCSEYLKRRRYGYEFDFGFNNSLNFYISLKFN